MAIWQFNMHIISKEIVDSQVGKIPASIEPELVDELLSWGMSNNISDGSQKKISHYLAPADSWSKKIKQFGNSDETCLELFFDNGVVEEIALRIDLRSVTKDLLNVVIDFCSENNGVLLVEQRKIIEPNLESIMKEIKISKAFSFIKNPENFICNISEIDVFS